MIKHKRGQVALIIWVATILIVSWPSRPVRAEQPLVDKLVIADTIQPVSAAQLDRALLLANSAVG